MQPARTVAGYAFGSTRPTNRAPKRAGEEAALQKFDELLHGQAGLSNDRAQRAGFQVSPGMNRNSYCSRRIAGIDKDVMTADSPIDDETRSCERLDSTFTADDWQPSAAHIQAATVT